MFEEENFKTYDFVEYSGNNLTITRNPFGFVNAKKTSMLSNRPSKKAGGAKTKKHTKHKVVPEPKQQTKKITPFITNSENQFVVKDGIVHQNPVDYLKNHEVQWITKKKLNHYKLV
jgi:hypothetical protein